MIYNGESLSAGFWLVDTWVAFISITVPVGSKLNCILPLDFVITSLIFLSGESPGLFWVVDKI